MVARVLGNANAITRSDLSGLCSGAYLRFLVSRAEKLGDHFRQASSGRNIQTELRDARANYDTAKLLLDSLLITSPNTEISDGSIDTKLRELNNRLRLPQQTPVDVALSHLSAKCEEIDKQIRLVQSLLSRARELGRNEAESNQLQKQITEAMAAENKLLGEKAGASAALATVADKLRGLASERSRLLKLVDAFERNQQSLSAAAGLESRLRDIRAMGQRVTEEMQTIKQNLDSARADLVNRATKLAQLRQSRRTTEMQRNAINQALTGIPSLRSEHDPETEETHTRLNRDLAEMELAAERTSSQLELARNRENSLATSLSELSRSGERFLVASHAMHAFVKDSHCPFCGLDHGSHDALERAIGEVSAAALQGADLLRGEFESVSRERQQLDMTAADLFEQIDRAKKNIAALTVLVAKRREERRTALSNFDQEIRRAGLTLALEMEVLRRAYVEVDAQLAGLDQEIRDATANERDDEGRRSNLEQSLAAKSSESEQLERLAAELNGQAIKIKTSLAAVVTVEEAAIHKSNLLEIEQQLKALEHEDGQLRTNVVELDRATAEKRTEIAGMERRLSVVEGFLASLDVELRSVGAERDVRTVLDIEQRTRSERDELLVLRQNAAEIKQDQQTLEQSRSVIKAQQQLREAERVMKSVQERQQRLQMRSGQFKNLHEGLQSLQNDTAEIVLESIHRPVQIVFRAMTAGCPWDIEFRLENGKVNAVLTDGSTQDVTATSVLNSAYVNVAAISLRLALASQQRWTRLRTIVLDDPILEMDHLTQSALIDGLEAVLTSAFAPWEDLQFVLTTWSEDFAVMAAHKLAHLNDRNDAEAAHTYNQVSDDFIIHRLSVDLDGTIRSQRHVPRWRAEASAA
jgi:chromosome segregation ATPase